MQYSAVLNFTLLLAVAMGVSVLVSSIVVSAQSALMQAARARLQPKCCLANSTRRRNPGAGTGRVTHQTRVADVHPDVSQRLPLAFSSAFALVLARPSAETCDGVAARTLGSLISAADRAAKSAAALS